MNRARQLLRRTLWAAGLVGCTLAAGTCSRPVTPGCHCLDEANATQGVERLAGLDWTTIDRERLRAIWPEIAPFPPPRDTGGTLEGMAAALTECCRACSVHGGAEFEVSARHRLEQVALWICPRAPDALRPHLDAMTKAVRQHLSESTTVRQSHGSSVELPYWMKDNDDYALRVHTMDVDDGSMALVQSGRCRALPVVERWPINDEWTVDVTELKYAISDDAAQELWFGYASRCAISDMRCFGNELDTI